MSNFEGFDYYCYFGDGNSAQIISIKETTAMDGVQKIRFLLRPTKRVIRQYNLKEKLEVPTNHIVREYDATEVVFLERGVERIRCWIMTDFMGGATKMSRRYSDLKENINDNDKLLLAYKAAKNRLHEELKIEQTQQAMGIRQKINLIKEVAKGRGRVDMTEEMMYGGGGGELPPE